MGCFVSMSVLFISEIGGMDSSLTLLLEQPMWALSMSSMTRWVRTMVQKSFRIENPIFLLLIVFEKIWHNYRKAIGKILTIRKISVSCVALLNNVHVIEHRLHIDNIFWKLKTWFLSTVRYGTKWSNKSAAIDRMNTTIKQWITNRNLCDEGVLTIFLHTVQCIWVHLVQN